MTAAFTMSREEEPFLRLWCNYYCNELGANNVYVLAEPGDETVAPAIDRHPGIHVIAAPAPQGLAFNERWRTDTVWEWHKVLLTQYKAVIFADTDEFLIPTDGSHLHDYCDRFIEGDAPYIRAKGWNVVHDIDAEPDVVLTDGCKILRHRRKMWHMPKMSKTLLTRQPISYSGGFHHVWESRSVGTRVEVPVSDTLDLCHLQMFDFPVYMRRHERRVAKMPPDPTYYSHIYTCGDEDQAKFYFRSRYCTWEHGSQLPWGEESRVPKHWKERLVY